ncbi:ABC transporter permease [Sphingobacterium wenxiniae]|uniref:Putative ABC transport system permease protein n=1 Tax=Sphingobacterium wenxiniae TaxID=683125 RepID=A0A1I6TUR6_9SPHI|nr:ABC transporter permease [Sphingobacterium wenxiniae]SFS92848.1 putative ABC transport system permease protein [Sphingobacterium wenxiniae]
MTKNFFLFFWRNLQKNKLFTFLNILGLALGFAGFILSYQYINRETGYDKWNANYDNIFLVGLTVHGQYTDQTAGTLAPAIEQNFPEVIRAGRRIDFFYGGYPVFGERTILVNKTTQVDSAAAHIFQVTSKTGPLYKSTEQEAATLVTQELADQLFPDDQSFDIPKKIPVVSIPMGIYEAIYGISEERLPSILDYDLLFIRDIHTGEGDPFTYQTFIQTEPGTNIHTLTEKINNLYQKEISKLDKARSSAYSNGQIYLDPLSNLHLRPKHGSNTPYLTVWLLGILSLVILSLAAANFVNVILAQADKRAKEIGLKKVFGGQRSTIALQFLFEVFCQCLLAAGIAFLLLLLTGNILAKWFQDDLIKNMLTLTTAKQLTLAILLTTLLSGVYPAFVLSGYQPVRMLKGGLQTNPQRLGFRNGLLIFQFVIATVFIAGALVVRGQIGYIRSSDKGFDTAQIITFKGVGMFYDNKLDGQFHGLKSRLLQDPNIASVSAMSNVPGVLSDLPPSKQFTYIDTEVEMDHINIDLEYFNTLGIETVQGKSTITFDQLLQDSTRHYAVINETAAKELGWTNTTQAKITGCDVDFTIIGIVKDSKTYGFENLVTPTLYSYKDECGPGHFKSALLVKTKEGKVKEAIQAAEREWAKNPSAESLPLEFEFLDQQYKQLHARQERLEQVLYGFTFLSIIIAALGLFSMSAYQINIRKKEMSIRKVLGASIIQLFVQLNKPFLKVIMIANLLAIPISYLLLKNWLNNFAYRVSFNPWVFVWVASAIVIILILSISYQSVKAARANPVDSLRDE